jgi:hypothetical protein
MTAASNHLTRGAPTCVPTTLYCNISDVPTVPTLFYEFMERGAVGGVPPCVGGPGKQWEKGGYRWLRGDTRPLPANAAARERRLIEGQRHVR